MPNLRCRPGDLAIIKDSWNPTMIGRMVRVRALDAGSEWDTQLCGAPALCRSMDRTSVVITRNVIVDDCDLVPIRGDEPQEVETKPVEEMC